jgi:hypothetical protein
VFNTSSGDHCIDQNSQSGQSPNMLFHSVAGAETFVKKHTAQHQDATSEEQFSTDTSLKVAHKRFGEREDNPDKSSKELKNLSVLEVYLEYTIRESHSLTIPALVSLLRYLGVINDIDNHADKLDYARDAIQLIRAVLAYGNFIRYAILKSGNLEQYLEEKKKFQLEEQGKEVSLKDCCRELFSKIHIRMSSAKEDDLLGFLDVFSQYDHFPEAEINGLPWKTPAELVDEIEQNGLYMRVFVFLDKMLSDSMSLLWSKINLLSRNELLGGKTLIFKTLREKHRRFEIISTQNTKCLRYAFQQIFLSDRAKEMRKVMKITCNLSSTSVRRLRSFAYKVMKDQISKMDINLSQYVDLFKTMIDTEKVASIQIDDFFCNDEAEFNIIEEDKSSNKESDITNEINKFQNNFLKQKEYRNLTLLGRKMSGIITNCFRKDESGIFLINTAMITENLEDYLGPQSKGLQITKLETPDHIRISPHIDYMHLKYGDKDYFWIKKKDQYSKVSYDLHPTNTTPIGFQSSNPDKSSYEFYPVTTEYGMFEVMEIKQFESLNPVSAYTTCIYHFFRPDQLDDVKSITVLQSYFKPKLCQMYPNYLTACSLQLKDGIDRRIVFLEGGTCYSIVSPTFDEKQGKEKQAIEFGKQKDAIEFFFRKHELVTDANNRSAGWYVLCKTTIVLDTKQTSATFACVDIGLYKVVARNKGDEFLPNEIKFRLHLFEIENFIHVGEQSVSWEKHQFFPIGVDTFEGLTYSLGSHHCYPPNIYQLMPEMEPCDFSPLSVAIANYGSLHSQVVEDGKLRVELRIANECPYLHEYKELPREYIITW